MESLKQQQIISVIQANIVELQELYAVTADPVARAKVLDRIAKQLVRLDTARKTPKI